MDTCRVTEAEALAILEADKAIDRGERMLFDLSEEQEKKVKKIIRGEREQSTAKPRAKTDDEKIQMYQEILGFLKEFSSFDLKNLGLAPKNNEINFTLGENDYSLRIIRHRKEKKA